jgi:hypothetical protein
VLLNRCSRPIWLSSIESMPASERPPKCPSDMSEPAYMSLMLESHCSVSIQRVHIPYHDISCSTLPIVAVLRGRELSDYVLFVQRKRCCANCFGSKHKWVYAASYSLES